MSAITTHILDTARGEPAAGVHVFLEHQSADGAWRLLGKAKTDQNGRVRDGLAPAGSIARGNYRLRFDTAAHFGTQKRETFFPEVVIVFAITDPAQHHHVPLLLSPFGYSTYRGS